MTVTLTDAAIALSSLHTLGALLGAGSVTLAEWWYLHGVAHGKLDAVETRHIKSTFFGLRWGMSLVLLSGLGLIVVEYFLPEVPQHVLFTPFWMTNALTVLILILGFLLSRKLVPLWFGGSASFTAWWMIVLLDASHVQGTTPSFVSLCISYVVTTILVVFSLACIRGMLRAHQQKTI